MTILRLESILGVSVLLCVGFMNVLGGTLVPAPSTPAASRVSRTPAQTGQSPTWTLETFDHRFQVSFTMTPLRVGTNHVQARIVDPKTEKGISTVKVQLNAELPEQNIGGTVVPLKAASTGQFSGTIDLPVSGTWRIIVQIQTPDDPYHFHEAYTDVNLTS